MVKVGKTDSCWEWTGAQFANGYGAFQVNGKTVRAHRFAWELAHGPIPEGIRVLHHCDNRLCCRPDHLFLGTDADNAADKIAKGRDRRPARPPRKTHCPQGHSYDEANTAWYRDWYYCRTCKRARSAAGYQRKKARIS